MQYRLEGNRGVCSYPRRLDSEKHIDFALTSPFGGGRPGRVRRRFAGFKALT